MQKKYVVVAALAVAPLATLAQKTRDPVTHERAPSRAPEYRSAFDGYRPYKEPEVARWRELNEEAGRLGGHVGHVPQQPGTASKSSAKPPAPADHGAHK